MTQKIVNNKIAFENFYMKTYIKLKDKHLVPKYVVDQIFQDFDDFTKLSNSNTLDLITQCKESYSDSETLGFVERAFKNSDTLYEKTHSSLRHPAGKLAWLKASNYYVEPQEIRYDPEDENSPTFEYTPIKDVFLKMMSHQKIADLYFAPVPENPNNLIRSFRDGSNFKNNELYKKEPNALQIILYTDNYDTNNPLGDNRKEDHINATYWKLGIIFFAMNTLK